MILIIFNLLGDLQKPAFDSHKQTSKFLSIMQRIFKKIDGFRLFNYSIESLLLSHILIMLNNFNLWKSKTFAG